MGGPLTRYALKNLGLAGKIDRVITLGSPHYGSRIAGLFPAQGSAAQMRYQSPFVQELAEGGGCPGGARFFSIYSNLDNFVLPVSTAVLEGRKPILTCRIWVTAPCCTAIACWIRWSVACYRRSRRFDP